MSKSNTCTINNNDTYKDINKEHYIEILPRNKNKDINTIMKMILRNTHGISIEDFNYDESCKYPRFYIYMNKTRVYVNNLIQIERELHELYKDGIIQYVGYQ